MGCLNVHECINNVFDKTIKNYFINLNSTGQQRNSTGMCLVLTNMNKN